jgi:hypothetical protein
LVVGGTVFALRLSFLHAKEAITKLVMVFSRIHFSFSATMGDTMRKTILVSLAVLFAMTSFTAVAFAKEAPGKTLADYNFQEAAGPSDMPADLRDYVSGPSLSSAAADTFALAWFNFGLGTPDDQNWTHVDLTAQLKIFWHVADGTELNGGTFGALLPLDGLQSMWCGQAPSAVVPYCGYATLPGYGNSWSQELRSFTLAGCDSAVVCYKIYWDSEPGYDDTVFQADAGDGNGYQSFAGVNGGAGLYDGFGGLVECFGVRKTGDGDIGFRFLFSSDTAWSDEDGLWPTDGGCLLDSISIAWYNEVPPASGNWVASTPYFEDFEGATPGDNGTAQWMGSSTPGFGDFAQIYPGVNVAQEDPCFTNFGWMWGFFDAPTITAYLCHTPNPLPGQGAMRYGPDTGGLYQANGVESPLIPNIGAGDEYNLSVLSYRDLPLDNLQFYVWNVRTWVAGCPEPYGNDNFVFYGGQKDWLRTNWPVGSHVNPVGENIQIRIDAIDQCGVWCGIYGTGTCHSHAPLLDQVQLNRVNVSGPQYSIRMIDLFQDTFAGDGSLTGTARIDMANDIAPGASPTIQPGDSMCISASPVGTDLVNGGPSAYIYVAVWPQGQAGKTPADMQSDAARVDLPGLRFPFVGTTPGPGAVTWACFRMDTAITAAGGRVGDRYCLDLNDNLFTPGDTICYVVCADDGLGNFQYWSRTLNGQGAGFVTDDLNEALTSPMEVSVLPGGGYLRGGDILYVDDSDDRGGPVQLFFDTAFDLMGITDKVDRFDILGPSSSVANSLASRVTNVENQITNIYRKIIWCSGNLSTALLGDGTGNPEKSDDYGLLFTWLNSSDKNPGLYLSGDDIAEEWVGLAGAGAVNLRSIYMSFNLADGSHINAGEAVSPHLVAVGPCFVVLGVPDELIAYGGCALINDFDVLIPTGSAVTEFPYPGGAGSAVISQTTTNAADSTARVILSGFSYHYIRDTQAQYPPARVTHLEHILVWLQNIIEVNNTGIRATSRNFLENAAPNPFNPSTKISYGIKENGHVSLKVYNVAGQLVRTLVNEVKTPAPEGFVVPWDGRNDSGQAVSSGVYFYKLTTSSFTQTKKMVLLK